MQESPKPKKKVRGTPIPVPSWWFMELFEKTWGKTDQAVTDEVNKHAAVLRGDAWDRSTIAKFRKGQFPTRELVEAFCVTFGIPLPFFFARSKAEALELLNVQVNFGRAPRPIAPSPGPSAEAKEKMAATLRENLGDQGIEELSENVAEATDEREARAYDQRLKRAIKRKRHEGHE